MSVYERLATFLVGQRHRGNNKKGGEKRAGNGRFDVFDVFRAVWWEGKSLSKTVPKNVNIPGTASGKHREPLDYSGIRGVIYYPDGRTEVYGEGIPRAINDEEGDYE